MFPSKRIKLEAKKRATVFTAPQGGQGVYEVHIKNLGAHSCDLGDVSVESGTGYLVESKESPPTIIRVPAGDTIYVEAAEVTELGVMIPNVLELSG